MQRRHDAGRDVRSIKLRDQFSKHAAPLLLGNFRDDPALLGQATEPLLNERYLSSVEVSALNAGLSRQNADVLPERLLFDHR